MSGRIVLEGILMLLAYIYLVRRGYVHVVKGYVHVVKGYVHLSEPIQNRLIICAGGAGYPVVESLRSTGFLTYFDS